MTLLARSGELLAMQAAGLPASRVWVTFSAVTLGAVTLFLTTLLGIIPSNFYPGNGFGHRRSG